MGSILLLFSRNGGINFLHMWAYFCCYGGLSWACPSSVQKCLRVPMNSRAKLGIIQGGGLQRASQDLTKEWGLRDIFLNFYANKLSLFRVSLLSD